MVIPGVRGAGGAERSLAAMAPDLCRHVDLTVVTLTGKTELRADLESAGARFVDLRPAGRLAAVRQLGSVLADIEPDVVHTTLTDADIVGRVAAMRARLPVVSSLVSTSYGRAQFAGSWVFRAKKAGIWAADLASARAVVRFHALTNHVARTASRQLLIPPSRITVIPRGRDPEALGRRTAERRSEARQTLGVADATPLVIVAARHEYAKGLDIALRAFAVIARQRPEVRFLIAGRDGRQSPQLRTLTAELGLDGVVEFIGQRDDIAALMCAADVWCVPSRWEGMGSILIEAMALEVPVVASAVPAIAEVGGSPSAFRLFEIGDHQAMARDVLEVLSDQHGRATAQRLGRRRFLEQYTAAAVSDQLHEFYRQAVTQSRFGKRSGDA